METNAITLIESNPITQQDIVRMLLDDKRSPATKRAYASDMADFFGTVFGSEPTPAAVQHFLKQSQSQMALVLSSYKNVLLKRELSEATVNRRIAAIKSLLKMGARLGYTSANPSNLVSGERVKAYRDTRGISISEARRLLQIPDRETAKGKRDYAILSLLWHNGLRRSEICRTNIGDFLPETRELLIIGKGRGTQKESIKVSAKTAEAISDYLRSSGRSDADPNVALFVAEDNGHRGQGRLTGQSISDIVKKYCTAAGIERQMSPHRIRHAAITAALDLTNGDIRKVQQFSRHANVATVMIYDDRRREFQSQVTDLLAQALC